MSGPDDLRGARGNTSGRPFTPASIEVRGAEEPLATALVVHGILGSAANWRGFLRKLIDPAGPFAAARRVRWIAVDLRAHGESALSPAPPPNTVAACAADLEALARSLGARFDLVLGHSFGGKVALAYARDAASKPVATWFLDTPIGGAALDVKSDGEQEIARVLKAVEDLGEVLPGRVEVQERLRAEGLSTGLAQWMTTNVRGTAETGYRWKFDLPAVRELIADYFALDLRPFVRAAAGSGGDEDAAPRLLIRAVRGGRSDRFDGAELAWQASLPEVPIHVLPEAGHWLHVDDPAGLMGLFERAAREVLDALGAA